MLDKIVIEPMTYHSPELHFPERFTQKLSQGTTFDYQQILKNLKTKITEFISTGNTYQEFFKDYTNHGISHINEVLLNADFLIPAHTFEQLSVSEVFYLTSSILLHDIALHIPWPVFYCLLTGSNVKIIENNKSLDDGLSWEAAFESYLAERKELQLLNKPKEWEPGDKEKRIVGEFIRKNHHRYAQEIAEVGICDPGRGRCESIFYPDIRIEEKRIIGIIARSHNHNMNDLKLQAYMEQNWGETERPFGVRIKYLMAVLRIADYMAIDSERSGLNLYRYIESKRSFIEHLKHKMIKPVIRSEIVNKVLEVHVYDPTSILEAYTLASELHKQSFSLPDVVNEVRLLLIDIQREINGGTEIVAALNKEYREDRFELNLEEINWKGLSYCPKYKNPTKGIYKLLPYRYPGYLIDNYLQSVTKTTNNIDFYVNDDWHPVKSPDLQEIYYPLSFKKLKGTFSKKIVFESDIETPIENIMASERPLTSVKEISQTVSGNVIDAVETSSHIEMVRDIFRKENMGTGIIADLGFGKTVLCKALLHFFKLRSTNKRELEKEFWEDLGHLEELQYIPLLYTCRSSRRVRKYTSVRDFIADALSEIIDEDSKKYNLLINEFAKIFHEKSHRILFIVDAIDELEDRLDGDIIREFMKFLMTHIVDDGFHTLVFTKRDGLETQHKEDTLRYSIEQLNEEQQQCIVLKLCNLYDIKDEEQIRDYLDVLTGNNTSLQLKKNVLNLTNSFIYYHKFNKPPTIDQFEKELIRIFFARKNVVYTEEMRLFLTEIALKIRAQGDGRYVKENELLELAEQNYEKLNFTNARLLIDLLTHRVGILKRRVEIIKGERTIIYEFNEIKQYQNLLGMRDAEGITHVDQIKPKINELLGPDVLLAMDQLPESVKRLIINILKYLNRDGGDH
ncbi:NACHT domain-containing protein [Mucilaginibacter dorajii]|uniref:NACHT domain-containing protein n=1 Tax=Mucilaginibacter dorajii TaxID=692994 RepID=A0ABP7Q6L0_9SPHI|nr:NACHT domain-containing protein [Mucilaginibacter dorajii]MCS3737638.1 hypothetical protein [Mucilaginibacter dorajii]